MFRHSLRELAFSHHGRSKDRIGGGDAGSAQESLQPCQRLDQPPDEEASDQPAKGHDRDQQEDDRSPVAFHVGFGQFDADGKTLHNEHDSRALESDLVRIAPWERIEQIGPMWTEDHAADGGHRRFANV